LKEDYGADLPRIPSLDPQAALAAFEVLPGFRVELVAAEPLVVDPVAFAFDAKRRLWVVEMRDYSEMEDERLGRVARLVDEDGDGRMDHRSTFVEGLSWPTAITCWKDGVIVAEPPHLWFFRDTDDDGVCDQRENWGTGFQRNNVQGLVNSFRWTVFGSIHGATSSAGAEVVGLVAQPSILLRGRDFEIDPRGPFLTPTSGGGQHGMSFNRWGDKFVTSNSDHLQQVLLVDGYRVGSGAIDLPPARQSIAVDGPQAEVFRSSPVEPWRIVRTQLRAAGLVPGVVEGGGRPAGYFTGATGTCIVDRELGFGSPEYDTALVCDVGSNLIHRKRLVPGDLFFKGERMDAGKELLRSKDIWFRPVQLGDGPDGCVYVADMYREVIEHPKSLPPVIKKHLDLNSGNDRGRIWRIVPTERKSMPFPPDLTALNPDELVAVLNHPIGWQRLTASRLLLEKSAHTSPQREQGAITRTGNENAKSEGPFAAAAGRYAEGWSDLPQKLRGFLMSGPKPAAWPVALHLLGKTNGLNEQVVRMALGHPDPRVRQHGVIALESMNPELQQAFQGFLEGLVIQKESSPVLRLQLALSAQRFPDPTRRAVLKGIIKIDTGVSPWMTSAVAISSGSGTQFTELCLDAFPDQVIPQAWLRALIQMLADQRTTLEADVIDERLKRVISRPQQRRLVLGLLTELPKRSMAEKLAERLFDSMDFAYSTAAEACRYGRLEQIATPAQLLTAARWSRLGREEDALPCLEGLLHPSRSQAVQMLAVESLAWRGGPKEMETLIGKWSQLSGLQRAKAWTTISHSSQGLDLLATAIDKQLFNPVFLAPDQQQFLRAHPNLAVRSRFEPLLSRGQREVVADLLKRYQSAIQEARSESTKAQGQGVFVKVCASCHRWENVGVDVGPLLGGNVREKTAEQLLMAILDPSREVEAKYWAYTVVLADGRVFSGLLEEEGLDAIVLRSPGGDRHRLVRSEIETMTQSGKSLMPEGLEQQISPEEMRSLIGFLKGLP
jgi:putative membrane-bound dehydrogenase-like protein